MNEFPDNPDVDDNASAKEAQYQRGYEQIPEAPIESEALLPHLPLESEPWE